DAFIKKDNVDLDKVEKYNSLLHELEEKKENILYLIHLEIEKERKKKNIKYYIQLIKSNAIKLGSLDYIFMDKNREKFKQSPKYIIYQKKQNKDKIAKIKRQQKEESDKKINFSKKNNNNKNISKKIEYTIIKDTKTLNRYGKYVKRSIDVVLNKKVTKERLKKIAFTIKKMDRKFYKNTFISYYLPNMLKNNGCWATTHFTPNLEVKIQGLSLEDEKSINKKDIFFSDRKIIGSWLEDRILMGNKMILYYKNNRFYLEQLFPKYMKTTEMSFEKIVSGFKIVDIRLEDYDEYYLLTKEGNFEFWSKRGKYYTAKKILKENLALATIFKMMKNWNATAYKREDDTKIKTELAKRKKQIKITMNYYKRGIKTYFKGKTNLPQNTKIGITINNRASDFKIYIQKDGSFISSGFSNGNQSLEKNTKVEILVYNNIHWQNKKILEKLKKYYGYGLVKVGNASIVMKLKNLHYDKNN
ncbi:MAG: hypothetical protein QM493_07280, partial [Sulfurovum sp.]